MSRPISLALVWWFEASRRSRALLAQALQECRRLHRGYRRTAIVRGVASNNDVCAPRKRGGCLESVFDIGNGKRKGFAGIGRSDWSDLNDLKKPVEELPAAVFKKVGAVWQGMPSDRGVAVVF